MSRITALIDTLCIAYAGGLTQHDIAECRAALEAAIQSEQDYTRAVIAERDELREKVSHVKAYAQACQDDADALRAENENLSNMWSAVIAERDAAQKECEEQARLLGMSGSREAALLSERDQLLEDVERLHNEVKQMECDDVGVLRKELAELQEIDAEPVAWRYHSVSPFADKDGMLKVSDKWTLIHKPDQRDAHSACCGMEAEPLFSHPPHSQPKAEPVQEPVSYEFQARDGKWCAFSDQRHYDNTIADGSWPIRSLYTAPQDGLRKAAQQALEALETLFPLSGYGHEGAVAVWRLGGSHAPKQAIEALREALK